MRWQSYEATGVTNISTSASTSTSATGTSTTNTTSITSTITTNSTLFLTTNTTRASASSSTSASQLRLRLCSRFCRQILQQPLHKHQLERSSDRPIYARCPCRRRRRAR